AHLPTCPLPRIRRHSYSFLSSHHPPTTVIYPLSLHDALPICQTPVWRPRCLGIFDTRSDLRQTDQLRRRNLGDGRTTPDEQGREDRKSTRLNSSHVSISYAVFCLKKKKNKKTTENKT